MTVWKFIAFCGSYKMDAWNRILGDKTVKIPEKSLCKIKSPKKIFASSCI